jgi:hypothetical protein
VARARKIERFLSQPFHVAEQFTGTPGVYVKVEESIRGFKEILEGKHDDLPERAFFMKGTIDQVVEDAGRDEGRGARGGREGAEGEETEEPQGKEDGAPEAEQEDATRSEGEDGESAGEGEEGE